MSRFTFNLDGVLRQRKFAEQARQRALADVQQQMAALRAEMKGVEDAVGLSNDDLRGNHLTGPLDMNFLAAHRRFMAAMQRKAVNVAQKMQALQRHVAEAQLALTEAAKARKAIEKLREKHFDRWRAASAAKDAAATDEMGMQISYRNAAEDAARGAAAGFADDYGDAEPTL